MSARSDVSPATLDVELTEDGIFVEYLDGRRAFYHGVPERATDAVRCAPGKEVQVLVTDPGGTEGVLVYVNDLNTHDDILASSGVGRVILEPGRSTQLFPGVRAEADGYAVVVTADPEVAGGRVFVFEEDEFGERSFEIVAADGD
ncbi:MAG: DUF5796 family protein [Halobacteriaceae archaeon]